ncbi:hypothetical protein O9992_11555 [Vibrio lentus]|nr:hypothetical protein [Vibrio lentus]
MARFEFRRRETSNNISLALVVSVKLGFIAQVFQLIRGGREPSLRGRIYDAKCD